MFYKHVNSVRVVRAHSLSLSLFVGADFTAAIVAFSVCFIALDIYCFDFICKQNAIFLLFKLNFHLLFLLIMNTIL